MVVAQLAAELLLGTQEAHSSNSLIGKLLYEVPGYSQL